MFGPNLQETARPGRNQFVMDANIPAYGERFFPREHHGSADLAGRYLDTSEAYRGQWSVKTIVLLSG